MIPDGRISRVRFEAAAPPPSAFPTPGWFAFGHARRMTQAIAPALCLVRRHLVPRHDPEVLRSAQLVIAAPLRYYDLMCQS